MTLTPADSPSCRPGTDRSYAKAPAPPTTRPLSHAARMRSTSIHFADRSASSIVFWTPK
jgi:hypothetical protein